MDKIDEEKLSDFVDQKTSRKEFESFAKKPPSERQGWWFT
jgi:hypothetical protein